MPTTVTLGDVTVDVVLKDIKNVHLSVYPPTGRVRISAPARTSLDTIRVFAISKLGWIRQQQRKLLGQERETPRDYVERESHYVWGKRYLLSITEADSVPSVELKHRRIVLSVRPRTTREKRQETLDAWYREQLKRALPEFVGKWERLLAVKASRIRVRSMKTKWGSCVPKSRSILLNTDLANKPPECLEYILVHELVHLLEPTHNARFIGIMDQFLPGWRVRREALNRLPVRHESWGY